MAVTTDSLLVDISVDTKDASKSIGELTKQFAIMNRTLQSSDSASKGTEKAIGGVGFAAVKLNAVLGLAKMAYDSLLGPIKDVVKEYSQYDKASRRVAASLQLVGQMTDNHLKSFQDFADEMQNVANVADDVTLSLVAIAKTSGMTDQQTKNLIKSSADLAALTDKDVNAAFRDLLGLQSGMVGRLQKLFPELERFTAAQLRSGAGLAFVSEKMKGLAEADAASLDGALLGLSLQFADFMKEIGKGIVELVDLPAVINAVKRGVIELKDSIGPLVERINTMATAFAAVDWGKVATGLLSIAGGFLAIMTAVKAYTILIPAIAAIGGMSSALAAMGGLSGIVSQLGTAFLGLAKAAWVALLPMLKIAAIVAAVVAVGVAIDLLVRNMDQMGKVWAIVVDGMHVGWLKFVRMVSEGASATIGMLESMMMKANEIAGKDLFGSQDAMIMNQAKRQEAIWKQGDKIAELEGRIADGAKSITIDWGLAGEAVKLAKGLMGDSAVETGKVADNTQDWADKQRPVIQNLEEQLKLLQEFSGKNQDLETEIANIGATQSKQLMNNLELELKKLDVKKKQLILEGKMDAAIAAQIDKQAALITEKADKQITQVQQPNLVSPDQLEAIQGAMGEGAAGIASSIGSAAGAVGGLMSGAGAVMGAVNGVLDFVQQLIDFIPQILSKVAGIFNSLTELPLKIAAGISDVMKSVINFVANFIPNLLKAIPEILDTLVNGLVEGIPAAMESMIAMVPELLMKIIEGLPDIVEKLVSGIVSNSTRMTIALVEGLIKGAPKIAIAMVKLIYIELPKAIVMGIVKGVRQIIDMLGNFFKGVKAPELVDAKALTASFKKASKALTGAASQMFNVSDLVEGVKGMDQATAISEAVQDGFDKGVNWLKEIWDKIISGLLAAWRWVYDTILKPFLDILKGIWDTVIGLFTTVFNMIAEGLRGVFTLFKDASTFVVNGFKSVFSFLKEVTSAFTSAFSGAIAFFKSAADALASALNFFTSGAANIGNTIWNSFKAGLDSIGGLFSSFGDQIWQGLRNGIGTLGDEIRNQLNNINPANMLQKMFKFDGGGKGPVENALSKITGSNIDVPFVSFAQGGTVPGTAVARGDSAMNDRILALLSPGEAVIPRSIMNDPSLKAIIDAVMEGKLKPQGLYFGEKQVNQATGGVSSAVGSVVGGVSGAISSAIDISKTVRGVASQLGKDGIERLRGAAPELFDALGNLDPQKLWKKFEDKATQSIFDMMNNMRFHSGGLVPGFANGGDVPAMLQAGEFVMSSNAVSRIGADTLSNMNKGNSNSHSQPVINMEIDIQTTQPVDDAFFRNKLMPRIKDELRRTSLDGGFVLSRSGVRTT